jgi:tol-pal system protein YbgF
VTIIVNMRSVLNPILFVAVGLFASQACAKTASEVFDLASKSVVVVYGLDANSDRKTQGSGIALSHGMVTTNCHVITGSVFLTVNYQQREYQARFSRADFEHDICILTTSGLDAPAATLGSARRLKVGARVYAIGAPKGLQLTLSEGIVSNFREIDEAQYVQTTAPISPGSSGGGLFDDQGRLVGLPTFYLEGGQQLNFAVPVELIKQLLAQIASHDAIPGARDYDAAFNYFREANYAGAIAGFNGFLKTYPDSALAPNAEYWIGYSYYALKDYRTALAHQQKLIAAYPTSAKVPDAILNIASNLIALDNVADARKVLEELVDRYPDTNAANLARRRLAALK